MKKVGYVIIFICAIATALAVIGINLSITGAKGGTPITIQPSEMEQFYSIETMDFPEERGEVTLSDKKKITDALYSKLSKMENNSLIERISVMDKIREEYKKQRSAVLKKGEVTEDDPEFEKQVEAKLLEKLKPYGINKEIVSIGWWDKICMYALVYRSVLLIFGFLGIGLGLAIVTSGSYKSDMD